MKRTLAIATGVLAMSSAAGAQTRPAVEHADRDVAAARAARHGHGASAVLDGICDQVVECLCESHGISVHVCRAGAPVERNLLSARQRHVPRVDDSSRDLVQIHQLGALH